LSRIMKNNAELKLPMMPMKASNTSHFTVDPFE
jgi:hypothetical protein